MIVVEEICGSILAYTKNWLVSLFDDKELSLGADAIGWNSFQKKKKSLVEFGNFMTNTSTN